MLEFIFVVRHKNKFQQFQHPFAVINGYGCHAGCNATYSHFFPFADMSAHSTTQLHVELTILILWELKISEVSLQIEALIHKQYSY